MKYFYLLHHNCAVKVYQAIYRKHTGEHISRSNGYVQNNQLHEIRTSIPILLHIIQWMINNCCLLWSCTHASKHNTKIPPHANHTPLHLHMIMHTKILTHAHLHKIPPTAHNITLHNHTIIHMTLFKHRPFTRTRKNCHNIKTYPGYITIYPNMSRWGIIPSVACCKWGSPTVNFPGITSTSSKRTSATFPETGCPAKRRSIKKWKIFDLLTMYILYMIDMWLVRL